MNLQNSLIYFRQVQMERFFIVFSYLPVNYRQLEYFLVNYFEQHKQHLLNHSYRLQGFSLFTFYPEFFVFLLQIEKVIVSFIFRRFLPSSGYLFPKPSPYLSFSLLIDAFLIHSLHSALQCLYVSTCPSVFSVSFERNSHLHLFPFPSCIELPNSAPKSLIFSFYS